jgi:SdpI/YhfL family protein
MSDRARLVVLLAVASALVFLIPASPAKGPLLMILLGLPLVFGLVPRNWLYGMRTPRTLFSSDEVWYIQNRITGVVMVAIGLVWVVVLASR